MQQVLWRRGAGEGEEGGAAGNRWGKAVQGRKQREEEVQPEHLS